MALFRRKSRQPRPAEQTVAELSVTLLYGGSTTLEVVGESYRQDNLWKLVGGQSGNYVRESIIAVLAPEDNPHDPNAIAIYISGLMVGYLSRDTAARYRPGLVRLMQQHRQPIALEGVIAGGGQRDDGIGKLGVFLTHDPADFVEGAPSEASAEMHTRTGAHELIRRGGLAWLASVPADDVRAIGHVRKLLTEETNPLERHFLFAELEKHLYHSREAFTSALDDYDAVCRDHDSEMETILPLLSELLDGIPLLDTYRQSCIRHQHAKDWTQALWWAERGLTCYGDRALNHEWPDYLIERAGRYRQAFNPAPKPPCLPTPGVTANLPTSEALLCTSCGMEYERVRTRGRKPTQCPACRGDNPAEPLIQL